MMANSNIKQDDLRINAIHAKRRGQVYENLHHFIIVKHIPSGITVTKYNKRSQLKARDEALEELEALVSLWECKC